MSITEDISAASGIISAGGIILYPTDTIWGMGCDATNEKAIKKIYQLKKREKKKSMIILVADIQDIEIYVSNPSKKILDFLSLQKKPATAIFDKAINLPKLLLNSDGTIGIRIVKDKFCQLMIKECGVPLVSTSANVSGMNYPNNFEEIANEIKNGVDYVAQHRRNDFNIYKPSTIIKLSNEGEIVRIR